MSATICPDDADFFTVSASAASELVATLSGFDALEADLDLTLRGPAGEVIVTSAGVTDTEEVRTCNDTDRELVLEVRGFLGATSDYELAVVENAAACCTDDEFEGADVLGNPRRVAAGDDIEGTICPDNDDYLVFNVAEPSTVTVIVLFDFADTDLDIELYGPDSELVAFSEEVAADEEIVVDLGTSGDYTLRVFGFRGAFGDYLADISLEPLASCTMDSECPEGTVCVAGECGDGSCSAPDQCTEERLCPVANPTVESAVCSGGCEINGDCRPGEACKWFVEGRACGDRGDGANGDACTSFADCGGQRTCVNWPGGYCARASCATSSDCESGTHCVAVGGLNVCVLDCLVSDSVCRLDAGYICDLVEVEGGDLEFACVPGE